MYVRNWIMCGPVDDTLGVLHWHWFVVWLSGNALVSINEVTVCPGFPHILESPVFFPGFWAL